MQSSSTQSQFLEKKFIYYQKSSKPQLMLLNIIKKPQDFILSNGKIYSVKEMISYAFEYFKLGYRKYIKINKIFYRKNEVKKQSDYLYYLKKNNINKKSFIHGKKLVHLMIKFYLNR